MADVERVSYGPDPANVLDLYWPTGGPKGKPVVMPIHGGFGQSEEDAETRHHFASRCASYGYVVAPIDYREWNHPGWPAQLQDCKAALAYLRADPDGHGWDTAHIGAVGFSLGGGLCGALATTMNAKPDVAASWSGPLDPPTFGAITIPGVTGGVCGVFLNGSTKPNPPTCAVISPTNRIKAHGCCPIRVVKGEYPRDFVPTNQLTNFVTALLRDVPSVPHENRIWPGYGHAEAVIDVEMPETMRFFDRFLK